MTRATILTYLGAPIRLVQLVGCALWVLCYELYKAAQRAIQKALRRSGGES